MPGPNPEQIRSDLGWSQGQGLCTRPGDSGVRPSLSTRLRGGASRPLVAHLSAVAWSRVEGGMALQNLVGIESFQVWIHISPTRGHHIAACLSAQVYPLQGAGAILLSSGAL